MGGRGSGKLPADIVNKKYSRLVVLRRTDKYRGKSFLWECLCDCGNTTFVTTDQLNRGTTKSCGCLRYENKSTLLTTQDWIVKSRSIHGDRYDYSKSEYVGANKKLEIICREHGSFWQRAADHTHSRAGCPSCSLGGFSSNNSGFLYVVKTGDITKVGITNKSVLNRINELIRDSGYEFEVIKTYYFKNGENCVAVETEILKTLRKNYKNPETKFSGYSECFKNVDINKLLRELDTLVENL